MKTWREMFAPEMLDKGEKYFRMGKAKKLSKISGGYEASVRGSRNYKVTIRMGDRAVNGFSCTCDLAAAGNVCHHMAAAMFLLEQEAGADEALYINQSDETFDGLSAFRNLFPQMAKMQEEELRELRQGAEDPAVERENYHFFRVERFRSGLNISRDMMKQAQKLIKDGADENTLRVKIAYEDGNNAENENELIGTADVHFHEQNNYYDIFCRVTFDRNGIRSCSCRNWKCGFGYTMMSPKRNLCPHTVAAILLTEEYLKKENPGDSTNLSGQRLMNALIAKRTAEIMKDPSISKQDALVLEPVIEVDQSNQMSLGFRTGRDKLYKVRNLEEFVEAVRQRKEMTFGKSTTLRLAPEYFGAGSEKWLHFMEDFLAEDDERKERRNLNNRFTYYLQTERKLGGSIPLYGILLDRFVDEVMETEVEASVYEDGRKRKKRLRVREGDIHLALELHADTEPGTGIFQGVRLTGEAPQTIDGTAASYYLKEDGLYRVSRETTRRIAPLLSVVENGRICVRAGRQNLKEFYYKTLPAIREMADLVEYDTEQIMTYLPPVPVLLCYLDVQEDCVVCRADALYGNRLHLVTDLLRRENGEPIDIADYRDIENEGKLLETLCRYLKNWDDELNVFFSPRGEEELYDFLMYGLDELMEVSEVRTTDAFRRLGIRRNTSFEVGVSMDNDLLNLQLTSDELSRDELLDILHSYHLKRKFVRLKNGDFFRVDENETLQRLNEMMEALHLSVQDFVAGKMHIPAYRALYLDKMLERTQDIYADRDSRFKKLIKEFKTVEDADYAFPGNLRSVMRNYQREGYRWLRTLDTYHFGGILADEMGLGKTLQAIAVLLAAKEESGGRAKATDGSGVSLVVCPASLVYNWEEELLRFAPELTVSVIAGTKSVREDRIRRCAEADVLVTSYDLLKRDIQLYENILFSYEILDEAQYIKNRGTAAAKSVKLIRSRTRFALTGTPIENRLAELWSIFDYLMPGFLYEYSQFQSEFEIPIVKDADETASERLRRMTSPFILRRRKQDVLTDLPEKLEEIRYASMETRQRHLYDAQVVRMKKDVGNKDESEFRKSRIQILAELTKIRQICCDPALLFADYNGGSAKREACMELLQSVAEGEHKALVFSQFTSMLSLLEEDLKKAGIPYYKITGETPKERRILLVRQFNEDTTPVFLISLKAGGTGLNLTGADIVVHYDPWWNLAVQNQATDRAHRIGQKKVVTVYSLIVKGTIEEKIVQMQEKKKQLAEDILNSENMASTAISKEDLMSLLE